MRDEDISDRTPILDILIEKWKYFNKHMKQMIEKYCKNSIALKEALERIMKYLGVESYDDIPLLLEKFEEQMGNIEMFLSKLSIDQYALEEQKRFVEMKIKQLQSRSSSISVQRKDFIELKRNKISLLKKQIHDFKTSIAEKEELFNKIKQPTDNFLLNLEKSYISEYVPIKYLVNQDAWYNDQNVIEILANVQDYANLADDYDNSNINKAININSSNQIINRDIEKLKIEMKNKIDALKSTHSLKASIKDRSNTGPFDEAIKKLSEELVKGTLNAYKMNDKESPKKK